VSAPSDDPAAALCARLARPQRHRLLQGYPALPQMQLAVPPSSPSSPLVAAGPEPLHDGVRSFRGALVTGRAELAAQLTSLEAFLAKDDAPTAVTSGARDARAEREARQRANRERMRPQIEARVARLRAVLASPDHAEPPFVDLDPSRDLIVGIIPHTQCTPRLAGCGFCTFPHDAPDKRARARVVGVVAEQIRSMRDWPELEGRAVRALYFGGGTANLASPDELARLVAALGERLKLDDAEVSLEGVPALFASWFHAPLRMLAGLQVRQRRISMGIQTFDSRMLERMGRGAFGDERTIRKLVGKCKAMGITTSGDFLFNLPGQRCATMLDDVDRALDAGLEQICLYNLVLYAGLGTPWSEDPELVAAMPDNETACERWLALRDKLLAAGYVQTTLTNFERSDVAASERAFVYERASFSPERTDGLGFGPMSLSMFVDPVRRRAVKLLRRKDLRSTPWSGDDLCSLCEGDDLRLLFVTRSLSKGHFDKGVYEAFCGSSVEADFPSALRTLRDAALIDDAADAVRLRPRGMFYSDAVVSTFLAEKRPQRAGAGIHTRTALAEPMRVVDYDGMG
jgi:oxygen-independent coproporphyrinogen-3 oxidase